MSENTYVLFDDTKECVIIDPGCYNSQEEQQLEAFITENGLKPVRLLNTHGHLDHIFGNKFIAETYKLGPEIHQLDLPVLRSLLQVASLYQLKAVPSPEPSAFLKEGDVVIFGNCRLEVLFTPGHSPGSVCFVSNSDKIVIGGDVLFQGSIGRTDLPGGDHQTLLNSIHEKLFVLDNSYKVYSGHGPMTTIGFEKMNNPFLN